MAKQQKHLETSLAKATTISAVDAANALGADQARALEAIIMGLPMVEAARRARIDKSTLYRWRTSDLKFMNALDAWRREQTHVAFDRLSGMAALATDVVQDALE